MIRRALPEDASPVAELFIAARACMDYLPHLHSEEETRSFIHDIVMPNQEVIVAVENARPLAFAALGDETLEHLYVAPEAQRKGFGSILLEEAKRRRPAGFRFYVFQANSEARRFYERHGCTIERLGDGSENEERLPDLLYRWQPLANRSSLATP